jgi:hypothetical protein
MRAMLPHLRVTRMPHSLIRQPLCKHNMQIATHQGRFTNAALKLMNFRLMHHFMLLTIRFQTIETVTTSTALPQAIA